MRMTVPWPGWIVLWLLAAGVALASPQMDLAVVERAGVNRAGEYVCCGIPVPREWAVADVNRFRLRRADGTPVPAQWRVAARWGAGPGDTSAPVKWLLAGYLESMAASTAQTLILDAGGPGPVPPVSIGVSGAGTGRLLVDTGAARFEIIEGAGFNLLDQVWIGTRSLLQPLAATEAIRYEPDGTASIVPGGSPDLIPRVTTVQVEMAGPLRTVLKASGSILDGIARPVLDFTARLYFTAGRPSVEIGFTVENNHPVIADENGQPVNVHDQGAVNSVYLGGLILQLRLAGSGLPLRVLAEQGVDVSPLAGPVEVYQDSSGTEYWDGYTGLVGWPGYETLAAPRLQSYCTLPGYRITGAGPVLTGNQALGWLVLSRGTGEPGVTLTVKDFWQCFPGAVQASPDGTFGFNLFPAGNQFHHNLRVGEEKTRRLQWDFSLAAASTSEAVRQAGALQNPLTGAVAPAALTAAGVLGEVPAADLARWPLYERYVRVALEPNPDFDPEVDDPNMGNSSLREILGRYNFYGWQDFGDVPLDYEAFGPDQAGQLNLKYWFTYAFLMQYLRSGDFRWFELGRSAAWHLADTDYEHIPDGGIQHWSHGAYFGHSNHDEPGNINPNRNSNSPSVDLFFGVPDLLLAYSLTGEERFREVALEGLAAMENLSQFSDFTQSVFFRERASLMFGYLEGYRFTGDPRWLADLRGVAGPTADLSNKPWLTGPAAYGATHPGEFISTFSSALVVWNLGRYLDFCQEYGLTDDMGVAPFLAAYADFILDHVCIEYRPGRLAVPHEYYFDGSDPSYLEINNWALTMADVMAYAYKYNGAQRYLDAAAKFYLTGTVDPVWEDDPPVYIDTKSLVNSCNWGLVYMNQSGPGARPGDLNRDGRLDALDLVILRLYLAGIITNGPPPFIAPLASAQMDASGGIDSADLVVLARLLAGGGGE